MSQQEREKEIQVHRDVLLAENKAAENERHKVDLLNRDRRRALRAHEHGQEPAHQVRVAGAEVAGHRRRGRNQGRTQSGLLRHQGQSGARGTPAQGRRSQRQNPEVRKGIEGFGQHPPAPQKQELQLPGQLLE